jgi:hypothetical protein
VLESSRMLGSTPRFRCLITLAVAGCTTCAAGGCNWRYEFPETAFAEVRDERCARALSVLRPRVGHTTEDEVRRVLGAPEYTAGDGSFFGYVIEYFHAPGGPEWYLVEDDEPDCPDYTEILRDMVVMQFRPDGVLQRYRLKRVPDDAIPGEYFERVADRWQQQSAKGAAPLRTPA